MPGLLCSVLIVCSYRITPPPQFFTPEELFLGERPAPYKLSGFDPRQVKSGDLTDPAQAVIANEARQEMILMVGSPVCTRHSPTSHTHMNT